MINHISFPNLGLEFQINRVAFTVFGMPVYLYGILIALGLVLAFIYASKETKRVGISQDDFINLFLIGIPASVIGARLYYVIFSWDYYKNNLTEIFNIRGGGIAIYGAVIGAALTVLIYCRIKKIHIGKVLDVLAIGLLIGQAIGRWGNFVNGEAFGSETDLLWSMTVMRDGRMVASAVHPTFLYESLWNLLGILALLLYKRRKIFEGELFCGYMVWYGFGRMIIEGLRTDSLYIGAFRVSQLLSVVLIAAGVIIIAINRKKYLTNKYF